MKVKKIISVLLVLLIAVSLFGACGANTEKIPTAIESSVESVSDEMAAEISDLVEESTTTAQVVPTNIVGMKGPTGLGMVNLGPVSEELGYTISYEATPDAVAAKLISGEVDIAAVPINLASTLYNKTEGEITLLAVNTLGVVYVVTAGAEVATVADLKGKTIYATGQGATPEYVLRYILSENGIDPDTDVEIIFESEGAAVVSKMATGEVTIAVLPEPIVTAAEIGVEGAVIALDLTAEWEKVSGGAVLTTGGVVVRNEFLLENPEAVATFMVEYEKSCSLANEEVTATAQLAGEYGIMDGHTAESAIPRCNIKFVAGEEMKTAVSEYLTILHNYNPKSVGGALPDEGFYYQK